MTCLPPQRAPRDAIALWRRHAARLEALAADPGCDPGAAAEFAEIAVRLRLYEKSAPYGLTFDRAAGLKPEGPGARNWWTAEMLSAQHAALERYYSQRCDGLSSGETAKHLESDIQRVRRAHGRTQSKELAPLAEALSLSRPLPTSARTIRGILARKPRVVVASDASQIDAGKSTTAERERQVEDQAMRQNSTDDTPATRAQGRQAGPFAHLRPAGSAAADDVSDEAFAKRALALARATGNTKV